MGDGPRLYENAKSSPCTFWGLFYSMGHILSERIDFGLISTMSLDLLSGSLSKNNGKVK